MYPGAVPDPPGCILAPSERVQTSPETGLEVGLKYSKLLGVDQHHRPWQKNIVKALLTLVKVKVVRSMGNRDCWIIKE